MATSILGYSSFPPASSSSIVPFLRCVLCRSSACCEGKEICEELRVGASESIQRGHFLIKRGFQAIMGPPLGLLVELLTYPADSPHAFRTGLITRSKMRRKRVPPFMGQWDQADGPGNVAKITTSGSRSK